MGKSQVLLLSALLLASVAAVPCQDDPTQSCPACEFEGGHMVIHAHSAKDFNFHCAKVKDTEICACRSHADGVKSLSMNGKTVPLSVGAKHAAPVLSSDEVDGETELEGITRPHFEAAVQEDFLAALAPSLGVRSDALLIVAVKETAVSLRRRLLPATVVGITIRWKFVLPVDAYGAARAKVADVAEVAEELAEANNNAIAEVVARFQGSLCKRCGASRGGACSTCAPSHGLKMRCAMPHSMFCEALAFGGRKVRVCCPSQADICLGRAKARPGCPVSTCPKSRSCTGSNPLCALAGFSQYRCGRRSRLGCAWGAPKTHSCWGWTPVCASAQYEARCRFFAARGQKCWWTSPDLTTPAPTPDPCQDFTPKRSCATYASAVVSDGKERGRMNYCTLARTTATRRRSWGADAAINCGRSCGVCAPKDVSTPAPGGGGAGTAACVDVKPQQVAKCDLFRTDIVNDGEEKGKLTYCALAKLADNVGSRRRAWTRDAKANCAKTCGVCVAKTCQGLAHPACLAAKRDTKRCRSLAKKYGCFVELDGGCSGGSHPACEAAKHDPTKCALQAHIGCIWATAKNSLKVESDANSNSERAYPIVVRHQCVHSSRTKNTKWPLTAIGCQFGRIRGSPVFPTLELAKKACSRAPFVGGGQGCAGVRAANLASCADPTKAAPGKTAGFVVCAAFAPYGTPAEACCADTDNNQLEKSCAKYAAAPGMCAQAFNNANRRRRNFGHDTRANCQKSCKACTTSKACFPTCFWQYDQFRRRQYSHRFAAHECTNGLPRGQCVTSLRSASASNTDSDWEAFAPGEASKGKGSYGIWDGNWDAGGAGFRFTNSDSPIDIVHVDYLCNDESSTKMPGQYSCMFEGKKPSSGTGVFEHKFTAKECGGEVPKGNCFAALHRGRAMGDQHHNWQVLGPRDGVIMRVAGNKFGAIGGLWDRQTENFNDSPVWKMRGKSVFLFKYIMNSGVCRWAMRSAVSDSGSAAWHAVKSSSDKKDAKAECSATPFAQSVHSWMVWQDRKWNPDAGVTITPEQTAFVSGNPWVKLDTWLDRQSFEHEGAPVWKLRGQTRFLFKYTPPHGRCRWAIRHRPDTVGSGGYVMVTSDADVCAESPFAKQRWYTWGTSNGKAAWQLDTQTVIETTGHASVVWYNSVADQDVSVKADYLCDREGGFTYKTRNLDNTIHHCAWSASKAQDARRKRNGKFWSEFDSMWKTGSRHLSHEFSELECTNGIPKGECTVGIRRQAPYNGGDADSWKVERVFTDASKSATKSFRVDWYQRQKGFAPPTSAVYDVAIDFICEPIDYKVTAPGTMCRGWTASANQADVFTSAAQCAHACRFTSGCRHFTYGKGRFAGQCHMAKNDCTDPVATPDFDTFSLTKGMTHDLYGKTEPAAAVNVAPAAPPAPSPTWPTAYPLADCKIEDSWHLDAFYKKCKAINLGPNRLPLYMFAPDTVSDFALEQAAAVQQKQLKGFPAYFTNYLNFKSQRMWLWNGQGSHVSTVKEVFNANEKEYLSHASVDSIDRTRCVTGFSAADRKNAALMQRVFDWRIDSRYKTTAVQANLTDATFGANCSATDAELVKSPADRHVMCPKWAANGDCSSNPLQMNNLCPMSCTAQCCSKFCACARRYGAAVDEANSDFGTRFPQINVRASRTMCFDDIKDPAQRAKIGAAEASTWVHETAVLLEHGYAGQFHSKLFREIEGAFANAKKLALWNNTIASWTRSNYLATLAEAYLGVSTLKVPALGTLNLPESSGTWALIDTRAKLHKYDPTGFAAVAQLYPAKSFPDVLPGHEDSLVMGCPTKTRPINFHEEGTAPPVTPEVPASGLASSSFVLRKHGVVSYKQGSLAHTLELRPLSNGKYSMQKRDGSFLSAKEVASTSNVFEIVRSTCDPSKTYRCQDTRAGGEENKNAELHSCKFYATTAEGSNDHTTYCDIARATTTRRRSWAADAAKACKKSCRMCTNMESGEDCPMEEFTLYRPSATTIAVKSRMGRWLSFDGKEYTQTDCNPILSFKACQKELFSLTPMPQKKYTAAPTPAPEVHSVGRVDMITCTKNYKSGNDVGGKLDYQYHRFTAGECRNVVTGQAGLPTGECMVSLRRTAACSAFDWAAQGPQEAHRSLYGSTNGDCKGVVWSTRQRLLFRDGDCSMSNGAAVSWNRYRGFGDAACTSTDIKVDYVCSAAKKLPLSVFTSCSSRKVSRPAPRGSVRRRRAGFAHVKFMKGECSNGLPPAHGHCFEALHRARSGSETGAMRNDRWQMSRKGVEHFGYNMNHDIRADYMCGLENNILRLKSGAPLATTTCTSTRVDHVEPNVQVVDGVAQTRLHTQFKDADCNNGLPRGNCVAGIRESYGNHGWDYDWRAFTSDESSWDGGAKGAGMSWMTHLHPREFAVASKIQVKASVSYLCDQD
jgi:hypothetical protein